MSALISTIYLILDIIKWIMILMIIFSWLISFNVVNTRNQFVSMVWSALNAVTDPILRPIRRFLPPMGGLDLSPLVVFVIIFFLQVFISQDLAGMLR